MKYNRISILILLLFFALGSCKKDFLDVNDNGDLYRHNYVKDLSTMQDFLNGVYVMLSTNLEHGYAIAYGELVADNLKPPSTTSTVLMLHYLWSQKTDENDKQAIVGVLSTATAMNPLWKTGYLIIRACNFVIEEIDIYRKENPSKADNIKGQALALRAYVHFKLVNVFGQTYKFTPDASHLGIPYITTSDITASFTRQTIAEVYSGMISDLKNAIQLLPETVSDTRYMNSPAAKGLLARIYLYKEDFIAAKSLAVEIASKFPLMTIAGGYPNDLYKLKTPSQSESLFQLSPKSFGYRTDFIGRYLRLSPIRFKATSDIVGIMKENPADVRQAWVTSASGQWNVTKYPTNVAPEVTPAVTPVEIAYYPTLVRSSEMYLIASECFAKTGDENSARTYLNAIRQRANPSITPLTATGSALVDSVYKERRKELAFEGFRMEDLQRWKLGVHRVDALSPIAKDLAYPNDKAIAPIPPFDVTLAAIKQNTGY